MKAGLGWIVQVVAWLVILAVAAVLAAAVLVPRFAGATPFTVLTSSMKPDFPPGTLVVARPVAFESLHGGDVITFQLKSGERAVVTHRVIAVTVDSRDRRVLVTQGDANPEADVATVRAEQVIGERWYSVPYIGHVSNVFSGRERQMGVYGTAAALAGYALLMFASSVRDTRRRRITKESVHV